MAIPDVDALNANPAVRQAGIAVHQALLNYKQQGGSLLNWNNAQAAPVKAAYARFYSLVPKPTGNDSWEIDSSTGQLKYNTNRGQTAMKIAGIAMAALGAGGAGLGAAGAFGAGVGPGAVAPTVGATAPTATAPIAGGGVGIWSNVAKYGKEAYDAYSKYGDTAGDVLGGISQAMAQNRGEANDFGLSREALILRARADAREAETDAYRKARSAAFDKNVQDVTFDRSGFHSNVPTVEFKGGRRPSAAGPEGQAAADMLYKNAMASLETAGQPLDIADAKPMSFWEKLAGGVGMGAKILGNRRRTPAAAPGGSVPSGPYSN